MKLTRIIKSIAATVLAVWVFTSCHKQVYNYSDGTPGDGSSVPSVTVDTNIKNVDGSKFNQARVFPGLVCSTEPRVTESVTLNLNYNYVGENLRISVPPQPMFSTGYYAGPGELIIIEVPANMYELSVQIGGWSDNLSSIDNAPRDPLLFLRSQLSPGKNYLRNLYGGHIYIKAGRPVLQPVTLKFTNVLKSPDFILGKTTVAQWQQAIRTSCVPWLELRSENIIFCVPRDYCLQWPIDNPQEVIGAWNDIILKDYYEWEGLAPDPVDTIDRAPLLPWRIVLDIKPSVGYGHAGYPIVAQNDYSWFNGIRNYTKLDGGGNWGYLHELGHNNQQGTYWSWSTLGEVTCNLFAFKVAKRFESLGIAGSWPPKHPALATSFPNALSFAALVDATKTFDGTDARINDPFARLTPFIQIFDKIPANWGYQGQPDGWGFMPYLYKKARRAIRISTNDLAKHDFVYEAISDYTRKDWRYFFEAWGIAISNIAQARVSAKYALMSQEIWKYNPLTRTGGDGNYDPYSRTGWGVTVSSSNNDGQSIGPAVALIDGVATSYWHTNYNVAPPHIATIDMKVTLPIKGFKLQQRHNQPRRHFKFVYFEYSTNGTTWTKINGSGTNGRWPVESIYDMQTFTFPSNITCRYFRITVPTKDDIYYTGGDPDWNNACLAEIDILKP